jgi:carbon monoxide dehydrogenase subunit G
MSDVSYFESRPGKMTCSDKEVFAFVTNIRNFERFIPQGAITNWKAERELCSFNVTMIGNVNLRLSEKEMYNKVVYTGDALKKNDFSVVLHISGSGRDTSEVKVSLKANLSPMLKMMTVKPIDRFMELLITEMESFRGWKETIE